MLGVDDIAQAAHRVDGLDGKIIYLVDCRFDLADPEWGRRAYEMAHLPGAVYASLDHDLSGALTGSNGRHPLPAPEMLAGTLGRLGIDRTTSVVA